MSAQDSPAIPPPAKMGDPAVQIARGRRIAEMRTRQPKAVIWKTVAAEMGLSIRQCQTLYNDFIEYGWGRIDESALDIIDHTIDTRTAVLIESWGRYHAAVRESDATNAIRALEMILKADEARLRAMHVAGRIPRAPAALNVYADMHGILKLTAETLTRANVPDDIIDGMLVEAQKFMPAMPSTQQLSPG